MNSILIIGKGSSEYMSKEIKKIDTVEEAMLLYGEESQLVEAFKEAFEAGAKNIYLCNAYKYSDHLLIINSLINKEFSYIAPLFDFSDKFTSNDGKEFYLCEMYSSMIDNVGAIILTSSHARYYEDVQQFADDMNVKVSDFKIARSENLVNSENLCFVVNNLKNNKYANVILASILSLSDFKTYPKADIDNVYFDLNFNDFFGNECIFFTHNPLTGLNVNNLVNFLTKDDPKKFIPNNIISNIISKMLSMNEFEGSLFNAHKKIMIENKISNVISDISGTLVENAKLAYFDTIIESGCVTISSKILVKPYMYSEYFEITMGS